MYKRQARARARELQRDQDREIDPELSWESVSVTSLPDSEDGGSGEEGEVLEVNEDGSIIESVTYMPPRKDVAGAAKEDPGANRRSSIGRGAAVRAGLVRDPTQKNPPVKRKVADEEEGVESRKGRRMSTQGEDQDPNAQVGTNTLLAEMRKMMEGLGAQMGGVREDIKDIREDLGTKIAEGVQATEELKRRMDENDLNFADKVRAVLNGSDVAGSSASALSDPGQSSSTKTYASCFSSDGTAGPSVPFPPPGRPARMSKEDWYWQCRRSLRLWPVVGQDIKKALREYLTDRLRLDAQFLGDMGDISIKKVPAGPSNKIAGEVIVVFSTVEVRDSVRRAAKELAGSSDAGVRLEIPSSMKPSLQALESISYNLKQKHAGIKRNIKFDDNVMDLVLDFNVNPEGGGTWRRISAVQAKAMRARKGGGGRTANVTDQELEGLLE